MEVVGGTEKRRRLKVVEGRERRGLGVGAVVFGGQDRNFVSFGARQLTHARTHVPGPSWRVTQASEEAWLS